MDLVIIPTYNEKENINAIISAVFTLPVEYHILIIDDGSPDGTADIVRDLMTKYTDRLFMIERSGKLGLGTAYLRGFQWAIEHKYDLIYEMDADFSHPPKDLLKLHEACTDGGADLAIGSRYISGVNVVNWPIGRVLMSYFASVYVRLVTGMKVMDTTAGFKCYTRKVLETIPLDKVKLKGYEIHSLEVWLQYCGSAYHIHRSQTGFVQNVGRHIQRSCLGRNRYENSQLLP